MIFLLLSISCVLSKTSLNSAWTNELGSTLRLDVNGNQLSGLYESIVGHATGEYRLVGWISNNFEILSWTVLWQNKKIFSNSITSWNGIYNFTTDTIVADWILTENTGYSWNSTLIGQDIFKPQN